MTFLGWLSNLLEGLSDLQLGDKKATLNHLAVTILIASVGGKWRKVASSLAHLDAKWRQINMSFGKVISSNCLWFLNLLCSINKHWLVVSTQPIWKNMNVKLENLPQFSGWTKTTHLEKPPPRVYLCCWVEDIRNEVFIGSIYPPGPHN